MEKLAAEIKSKLGEHFIMLSYNWYSASAITKKVHDELTSYGSPLRMDTEGGMHGSITGDIMISYALVYAVSLWPLTCPM